MISQVNEVQIHSVVQQKRNASDVNVSVSLLTAGGGEGKTVHLHNSLPSKKTIGS